MCIVSDYHELGKLNYLIPLSESNDIFLIFPQAISVLTLKSREQNVSLLRSRLAHRGE